MGAASFEDVDSVRSVGRSTGHQAKVAATSSADAGSASGSVSQVERVGVAVEIACPSVHGRLSMLTLAGTSGAALVSSETPNVESRRP
ncbi:hypothetical protein GCM10010429_08090 [Micromonospora olivasterospora]